MAISKSKKSRQLRLLKDYRLYFLENNYGNMHFLSIKRVEDYIEFIKNTKFEDKDKINNKIIEIEKDIEVEKQANYDYSYLKEHTNYYENIVNSGIAENFLKILKEWQDDRP